MRILFVIRSLNRGGAERQLVATARGLQQRGHAVAVAVFYGGGSFEEELLAAGVPVHDLAKRGRWDVLPFMVRAARLVRARNPELLVAYGGANAICSALKAAHPRVKVVWGIRTAKTDLRAYDWLSRLGPTVDRALCSFADAIVANSHQAQRAAIQLGLPERKLVVVPNGIDCEQFRPDPAAGLALRREWGIAADARVVGMVARLDPVKSHETFVRAAAEVAQRSPGARFVCVGRGTPARRSALEALTRELGLASRLTWTGELKVTRSVYSAFDVAVLSSNAGESFPNTVAEAMACGRPCVVTDSGDMRSIVGDTGVIVPSRDAGALARGIEEQLARVAADGEALGARARGRIEREFSVPVLVDRTERVLAQVLGSGHAATGELV